LAYYEKRREQLIEAKFRNTIYKLFKQICPICEESLHNGEVVELHHIKPQKSGGKYSLENIVPLHQICHQQVTHGNQSLERFRIALPKKIKKKNRKEEQ
jgi:5-methylcytosine-specific restriction endonuclease McrA